MPYKRNKKDFKDRHLGKWVEKMKDYKYSIDVGVTHPYEKGTYDPMSVENLMKVMERLKKEEQEDPKNYCRLCGTYKTKNSELFSHGSSPQLCVGCYTNITESFIKSIINQQPKKELYCPKCSSHINACACPERMSLKKLKK